MIPATMFMGSVKEANCGASFAASIFSCNVLPNFSFSLSFLLRPFVSMDSGRGFVMENYMHLPILLYRLLHGTHILFIIHLRRKLIEGVGLLK